MRFIFSKFDKAVELWPENTAVIYLGEKFTYRQLRDLSLRFSSALKQLGVKKGDKVMLYIPNCIQWVVAFLGIIRIGAVVVPALCRTSAKKGIDKALKRFYLYFVRKIF